MDDWTTVVIFTFMRTEFILGFLSVEAQREREREREMSQKIQLERVGQRETEAIE